VGHLDAPDGRIFTGIACGVKEKTMRLVKFVMGVAVGWVIGAGSHADVLLDQPVDFRNAWDSFYPPGIQFGDDFIIDGPTVVESAVFHMVATTPNLPFQWSMSVHRGSYDHDIYDFAPVYDHVFRMFNPSSVTDLGPWPGDDGMHLFEVRFDNIGLLLEPYLDDERAFWFSCAGHLRDYPRDRCAWATAGNGVIHGDMGYFKYAPGEWPGWSLMTRGGLPPSDLAMRIEGVPADEYEPSAELTGFEVAYGSHVEGGVEDAREAADGRVVSFRSKPGRRDGAKYYLATVISRHQCLIDDPDVLDVSTSVDVQRLFLVPTAILWLRNWTTGEWDEVGRHFIHSERDTWPFRDIPAADYLDENNEIEMKFEVRAGPLTHPQEYFTFYFEANIDRVRIDARRVD
jgi:hypothetical protein